MSLAKSGHTVAASVRRWRPRAEPLSALEVAGINLEERWASPFRKGQAVLNPPIQLISRMAFGQRLARQKPDLVCASLGSVMDDLSWVSACSRTGAAYVLIIQAASESLWPNDDRALTLVELCQKARKVFFVSEGNRSLLEIQLGVGLSNAEVVRNPFNVRSDASPPWPVKLEPVRLACVGRLDPDAKGQDLLFQVLASEQWRSRDVILSIFGSGGMEQAMRRLAQRLGLDGRVKFCGHAKDIEGVWAEHHALVMPSRFEGLPLAVVEAMLCGRPAIVTDVAGNKEVVEDGVTGFVAEAPTKHHLSLAMERAWECRDNWQRVGQAAAAAIRKLVPPNPGEAFAVRLLELTGE